MGSFCFFRWYRFFFWVTKPLSIALLINRCVIAFATKHETIIFLFICITYRRWRRDLFLLSSLSLSASNIEQPTTVAWKATIEQRTANAQHARCSVAHTSQWRHGTCFMTSRWRIIVVVGNQVLLPCAPPRKLGLRFQCGSVDANTRLVAEWYWSSVLKFMTSSVMPPPRCNLVYRKYESY